jgi:hypothetical protein
MRCSAEEEMSESCCGARTLPADVFRAFVTPVSSVFSTIVFHSPQAGQRPIHLEYSFPQEVQYHTDLLFDPNVAIIYNN